MLGFAPISGAPISDAGRPPVINYSAGVVETGVAAEINSALFGRSASLLETVIAADTSAASSLLLASALETGAAADLSSSGSMFFATYIEPDSVYELTSIMATFFAGSTDASPMTDATTSFVNHPTDVEEVLTAADSPSAIMPIPPRSINELSPLTDESHTPPFVPGVAEVDEFMFGVDLNTASIMQSTQQSDELLMGFDSESAIGSVGYGGTEIETGAAADTINGSVFVYLTAAQVEGGSAADTTDGAFGLTGETDETDYFLIEFTVAAVTPTASVGEALSLSDTESAPFAPSMAVVEALAAVDHPSVPNSGRVGVVSDTPALVDQASDVFNAGTKSIVDTLAAVDHPSIGTRTIVVSVAEVLAALDTSNRLPGLSQNVADMLSLLSVTSVPTATLLAAIVEAAHAVDASSRSFLIVRVQAETANAAETINGTLGLNYRAADAEAMHAADLVGGIVPYFATKPEVLNAADREFALDVSGFILGNPQHVTVEYRRRVWVISSTRQD